MKHYLLYILLISSPFYGLAQTEQESAMKYQDSAKNSLNIVKEFIADLSNNEIALDVILSKWVIVNEPSDELYDYLEVSLEEIRLNLNSKNLAQIQFRNYNELPKKDVRDIDSEGMNINNMYFLYYRNRLVTSLYVDAGKIGSFTLVSKGGEMAHFITY